jgi:hypothetical protein
MFIKTSKETINRGGTHMWRCVGLLLTSFFFLGVVSLAMHHHAPIFQLKSCAICKAKTSLSGTLNKDKADSLLITATTSHCSEEIYFTFSRIEFHHTSTMVKDMGSTSSTGEKLFQRSI